MHYYPALLYTNICEEKVTCSRFAHLVLCYQIVFSHNYLCLPLCARQIFPKHGKGPERLFSSSARNGTESQPAHHHSDQQSCHSWKYRNVYSCTLMHSFTHDFTLEMQTGLLFHLSFLMYTKASYS